MSSIQMVVEYCTCCLYPVEQCKHGQPVSVIAVDCPGEVMENDGPIRDTA